MTSKRNKLPNEFDILGFRLRLILWLEVTIAEKGGVDVILTAMKMHESVAAVQTYGCGALASLAANAGNQVTIAKFMIGDQPCHVSDRFGVKSMEMSRVQ